MSNLKSLKAVRTKYRNILDKEITNSTGIVGSDITKVDKVLILQGANMCLGLLKSYSAKLEEQMNKLTNAMGENVPEITEKIVDEDCHLIFKAEQSSIELSHFVELVQKENSKQFSDTNPTALEDKNVLFQEQLQKLMISQLEQQKEFFEKQNQKENHEVCSVKLPKLDLISFSGDKMKWASFWDAFECTIHNNDKLSCIDKFNYLMTKLYGEARRAVSGLSLSNENYTLAIGILKERFGDEQEAIDLHYHKLMKIPPIDNTHENLRMFLDSIEKHLRSLEVLKEDINQHVFVSMIRSKLPKEVLRQLELMKGPTDKWTVDLLRETLHSYVIACEHAQINPDDEYRRKNMNSNKNQVNRYNPRVKKMNIDERYQRSTAESLLVNQKQVQNSIKRDHCRYCDGKHYSDECLKYKTIEERKNRIKGSCFRCLRNNHLQKECKWNKKCVYCGEHNIHHRSLCPSKFKHQSVVESVSLSEETCAEEKDISEVNENVMISAGEMVLMQTATTEVNNPNGNGAQNIRVLLDCGSQRTYITQKLADNLKLKGTKEEEIKLVTFGSDKTTVLRTKTATLNMKLNDGKFMPLVVNIVPVISGNIQRRKMDLTSSSNLNHLIQSLDLADTISTKNEMTSIEMLIGNDYYLDIILSQKMEVQPGLYLLGSKLGWILSGRTPDSENGKDTSSMLVITHGKDMTESGVFQSVDSSISTKLDLQDFWNIEAIGITDDPAISDDEKAMQSFKENIKFEDGRYQVTWPWKEEHPDLPVNRELAYGRLKSCINKLKNKPDVMEKYNSVIQDQIDKGIVEKVDYSTKDSIQHYIPHHAVITPQKTTTKLRVVYDASAKTRPEYKSLNECLFRGPVMLQDLCGLLMRFRLKRVALISDIEKAFLQIGLQPNQRDVTRFLWLKDTINPSVSPSNIQEYRFRRVPFGVISSPFLLGATVETHLDSYKSDVARKLKNDIYVDNVITGSENESEAILLYKEAKQMFTDASMNLREWLSNSDIVNEIIPREDRAEQSVISVLGHIWNSKNDTIAVKPIKVLNTNTEISKRSILKVIASVFDPLGLFSPIILRGKLLLQDLWSRNLDWDDPVEDTETKLSWTSLRLDLYKLSEYTLPRCLAVSQTDEHIEYHLLCFCDASSKSYSAVVYLRQESKGLTKVDLMFSKTRLTPIKGMTIPRLELMAVLIGVRCLEFVSKLVKLPIKKRYLWTDSVCVLGWLNSNKVLPVFVRNRVNEILRCEDVIISYTNTKQNPADVATRGTTIEDLNKNEQWWHGPSWLLNPCDSWFCSHGKEPLLKTKSKIQDFHECDLLISSTTSTETSTKELSSPFEIDVRAYSSITKLFRVTALARRFVYKLRKQKSESIHITANEIEDAEKMWLLYIQKKNYPEVYEGFSKNKPTNIQKQLGLYLDDCGILRSKGRLENASLSEGARCPILLPKKDIFTRLVVESVHKLCLHTGISQTLASVRHKYWIPQGRAVVRSVISACTICRKVEGGPYKMPNMPSIPKMRVSESSPFTYTGLDYLGPFYIKHTGETKKVWICIFTCLVIRAIHLEVIQDMSSEEFMLCLRRFISQRGTPIQIISDNASQFKSASTAMYRIWKNVLCAEEVQTYVATRSIKWSFNVELAPWMGGFYERLVGIVKRCFRKSIGRKLLTLIQFITSMKEVEAVVNSRPLVYVGDDINSTIALTPNHFLSLNPFTGIPEMCNDETDNEKDVDYIPYENTRDKLLALWKKGQNMLNSFWKMWREDYLMNLRERMQFALKTGKTTSSFKAKEGDVVLIKDNLPRGCWRIGKVLELVKSRDGYERSAKVALPSGKVLGRPINLLYPVECQSDERKQKAERPNKINENSKEQKTSETKRPSRKAAISAREKIIKMI
ncbi:uncharacterized protein LOC132733143 [Ruditapes philippinarum]|uniref:uncharacterized protein LOC132733143 n=1 Tax=Ruditapes philippinarum TaxID=129788 RepID=UPI00295AD471|nr:uncharacterized protein LOC132733143 [Ruditapes philippinarum]